MYSFVVVLLLAGLRGNQTCFCWHSVLLHFETSSSVCLFKLSSGVRGFFICLRVGTHNFFTYADMGLCGFPTFKPSNRPSILKLEQTSSRDFSDNPISSRVPEQREAPGGGLGDPPYLIPVKQKIEISALVQWHIYSK